MLFENKKIIIIAVVAVLVLGIGIFAGYSLLNKDNNKDLPVVKEDDIPDYDHSAVIEALPEDKGIDVSNVSSEVPEEVQEAIDEYNEELRDEIKTDEFKNNAVTIPEGTENISIPEEVVKNNDGLAKLKEDTKDIVIVETPKEPINNDVVTIPTEKVTEEQLMAALNDELDKVLNKEGFYYSHILSIAGDKEWFSEEKLIQDIDKIKNNFSSSKHLVEFLNNNKNFPSNRAYDLFIANVMDWLAFGGDEHWKEVKIE